MHRFIITVLILMLVSVVDAVAAGPPVIADNVVMILVDGLRPDALKHAKVPTIDGFIKHGSSTMQAQTVEPSLTLPATTSMLTGLPVDQHGITWNEYEPMRGFLKAPTVFEIASFAAGKLGAVFLNKEKLLHIAKPDRRLLVQVCSVTEPGCNAQKIATDVIRAYRTATEGKPSLFLIHVADLDVAGHEKGWMTKPYLQALESTDRAIATIVKGFQDLGLYKHTVFILTSDHGGHDKTHGTNAPEDMIVPWIAAGPGVKSGYVIKRPVSLMDTAATVLRALGVTDYYVEWSSQTVEEIFLE
ncbi:MAG TPA: alkaline phosphatase family protein [Nitrospirales bacterium]|jgi:predicted AlkP superfamily pyrophosphatase or phosphodiesterase